MNAQTLTAMAAAKKWNQSDIARAAGVSRQRVSQWFKEVDQYGYISTQIGHARLLAAALGVNVGDLLQPWPLLADSQQVRRETTKLLWDFLYPDLLTLLIAALEGRRDALARVVQVYGLYASANLFGIRVWRDFPKFKSLIKPARRTELEHLWKYQQHQMKA